MTKLPRSSIFGVTNHPSLFIHAPTSPRKPSVGERPSLITNCVKQNNTSKLHSDSKVDTLPFLKQVSSIDNPPFTDQRTQRKLNQSDLIFSKSTFTGPSSVTSSTWKVPTHNEMLVKEPLPKITGLVPNPLRPSLTVPTNDLSTTTSTSESTIKGNVSNIRADEVRAALLSKPQRGRKRENLNVLERLELTRTRNREHAKSTRIRKKARYQELLEKEKKYEDLLKKEDLNRARKKCLINFMKLRSRELVNLSWPSQLAHLCTHESMGKKSSTHNENPGSPFPTNPQTNNLSQDQDTQSRGTRHLCLSQSTNFPDIDSLSFDQALHCVLDDPNRFQFNANSNQPKCFEKKSSNNDLEQLRDHDYAIREHVVKKFGATIARTIQFSISSEQSLNDVTLTSDVGFAQHNVLIASESSTKSEIMVFKGVTKVQFTPGSSKLAAMEVWMNSVNMDYVSNPIAGFPEDFLISYPSVVSLENPSGCENENANFSRAKILGKLRFEAGIHSHGRPVSNDSGELSSCLPKKA